MTRKEQIEEAAQEILDTIEMNLFQPSGFTAQEETNWKKVILKSLSGVSPNPANAAELDHPCKETCSGWKQGYERGKADALLTQK